MVEKILHEDLDHYSVEFTRGTSGGKIGFTVKVKGEDKVVVMEEARSLVKDALNEANILGQEG